MANLRRLPSKWPFGLTFGPRNVIAFASLHALAGRLGPMEPLEPSEVVRALWNRIQERDWAGVGELVAEHAVIDWPATKERIAGRDNYVAINREYPEGWSIRVLRVIAEDELVVSEVEVPHSELGVFRVVSLWTVTDRRIVRGTEYWITVGAEEPAQWRARYAQRY